MVPNTIGGESRDGERLQIQRFEGVEESGGKNDVVAGRVDPGFVGKLRITEQLRAHGSDRLAVHLNARDGELVGVGGGARDPGDRSVVQSSVGIAEGKKAVGGEAQRVGVGDDGGAGLGEVVVDDAVGAGGGAGGACGPDGENAVDGVEPLGRRADLKCRISESERRKKVELDVSEMSIEGIGQGLDAFEPDLIDE